jgi:hypothetical protein
MIDPIWRGRLAIADVLIPLSRHDPFVPAIRAGLALRTRPRASAPPCSDNQKTPGETLMNVASSIAPVIAADNESLQRDFPLKPFAIRHKLSGHPLLTLSRIAQLAADMPRDLIEYNSGDASVSQTPTR